MKIVGIITEYNPLHNGHLIHINKTREISNCDVLIAVMSGNFTMRGDLAIASKYKRAQVAINQGVDLVVELPLYHTVQSMDYFSLGSIMILDKLGVQEIYFGSESNDITLIEELANIEDNRKYQKLLKAELEKGHSFPSANSFAINQIIKKNYSSNDILGASYLRSIKIINSKIKAFTIKRESSAYLDKSATNDNIASAIAIRKMFDKSPYLPSEMLEFLNDKHLSNYYDIIRQIIISQDISNINLVSEGIENFLKSNAKTAKNYDEFLEKSITKRYTLSRIKRIMVSVLLNITKEKVKDFNLEQIEYIRVLKMNEIGQKYLNSIKKDIDVTLVTNFKDFPKIPKEIEILTSLTYDFDNFENDLKEIVLLKGKENEI